MDKEELAMFGKYLRKYHSGEKIPMEVFRYFKQLHSDLVSKKPMDLDLAAQKIAKSGAVKGQYNQKRLLDTFHDLFVILKRFLMLRKLADKSLESEVLWLMVQKDRKLLAQFEKGAYRLIDGIRAAPKMGEEAYLSTMLVEFLDCMGHIDAKYPGNAKLASYSRALEAFYQISKLKLSCEIANQANIRGSARIDNENSVLGGDGADSQFLYKVYSYVLPMLQDKDEAAFLEVVKLLSLSEWQLDEAERFTISGYLQNFCAEMMRQGRPEYRSWSFEIFKSGLGLGLYFDRAGNLTVERYFNILSAAIAAGKFPQATSFMETYLPKVVPVLQDEVRLLSNAMLFFAKRLYKKALTELKKLESQKTKSMQSEIRGRLLKIACMAGQDFKHDSVLQEVINCKNYLSRNVSDHEKTRKAANNFLEIVRSMCQGKKSIEKIRKEIEAAKDLLYAPWLLELLNGYRPDK